ncbi:MAG: hypothetical protein MO853_10185 [Candidatus Protistobacter heckmanni]|nr:hypothetical protein [Candidatus Protistobacter heckmanni]
MMTLAATSSIAAGAHTLTAKHGDAACNQSAASTALTITVDTTAPVITSAATASFTENGTGTAYTETVTDASTVTHSLSGSDASKFNINSSTGAVTFASAPNFESPQDVDANNIYDIVVTATDAAGNVGLTKGVAITVTNANEDPVTSGKPLANKTVVVNQAFSYNTSTGFTDPDAGSILTCSATGLPAGFTINPTRGVLSGTAASTFAATSITVTANDGSLSSSQSFTLEAVNGLIISSISHSTTTVKGGTALSFTVTMSENVTVTTTGGNPILTLSVNGQSVTATYSSGNGTSAPTFTATAPATGDGNAASVSAITIPGTSSIKDSATSAKNLLTTVMVEEHHGAGDSQYRHAGPDA